MWSGALLLLLLATLPLTLCDEDIEITTVYDLWELCTKGDSDYDPAYSSCKTEAPGRVHARKQAIGLPLAAGTGKHSDIMYAQTMNLTCDPMKDLCNWEKNNWSVDFMNLGLGATEEQVYEFSKSATFSFSYKQENIENIIAFTTYPTVPNQFEEFIIIVYTFSTHRRGLIKVFKRCQTTGEYHNYRFEFKGQNGQPTEFFCKEKYTEFHTGDYKLTLLEHTDGIALHSNGNIQCYISKKFKYISFHGTARVLMPTQEGNELVSPTVTAPSGQLCLVLAIHSNSSILSDVLLVSVQDMYQSELDLISIDSVARGWNIKQVRVSLDSDLDTPVRVLIKSVRPEQISISWISSCSTEGEEVNELLPTSVRGDWEGHADYDLPVYTISPRVAEPLVTRVNSTNTCVNGGLLTSQGCSCPPGFYGPTCQSGCGKNRFGQDCGVRCSLHPPECKGLLLCTPLTKCHCAPGYTGRNCKKHCSSGTYGNDCEQDCGHCEFGSSCDIYTGECASCQLGYTPPYCKEPSLYHSFSPLLVSPEYGTILVTFDASDYVTSGYPPELYEIQYREKNNPWIVFTTKAINVNKEEGAWTIPPPSDRFLTERIEGLKDGAVYEVRVLLIDANFNTYDGELVKISDIVTKCDIPEVHHYDIRSMSKQTEVTFTWNYENDTEHWCPLLSYEVLWKDNWQWITNSTTENSFSITNLLPGAIVLFKVRAKTTGGYAPFSKITTISTLPNDKFKVSHLRALSSQSSSAKISWDAPPYSEGRSLKYTISYKCVRQPACPPGCANATEGVLTVDKTAVTLSPLLPFARYQVTVTPEKGSESSIYLGTSKVAPSEVPGASSRQPLRTNTSLTVSWDQQPVCSSYLQGYNYQLVKEGDTMKILDSGFTKETSASFYNLTASTEYVVRVYVSTLAGWNPNAYLAINVSTTATVPEAVQNLTVYKRGRSMLGLRWAAPRATYGQLKSFTVKHSLGKAAVAVTVEPTPCTVWPDLYCHTIEGLRANQRYNVTVSARNTAVKEDGTETYVTDITKESIPTAPEYLKVINSSSYTVGLQWKHPKLANGIIRSFVVNVEETEKFHQETCCEIFPLVETPVQEELETYEVVVSGLHPASMYFVSVSAKTVGLGPSQSLVVYTRPPYLAFTDLPNLQYTADPGPAWLAQTEETSTNDTVLYSELIRTHLLLAAVNQSQPDTEPADSGILNPQLDALLHHMISGSFFFVTEYTKGQDVYLNDSGEDVESEWGQQPSAFTMTYGQQYQLVAVQVTEYNGVYNADLRYTNTFTLL